MVFSGVFVAFAGGGGGALPVVPTKSVVLFAGPVKVNRRGEVQVELDIPDFNDFLGGPNA